MPINLSVPGDTQVTVDARANSDNNYQRVKIEWDNGNGPTDTFTTTTAPPYSDVQIGTATRDSGSSGAIRVTVEHSSDGTNWQASSVRLKASPPSGEQEVQASDDPEPEPAPEPWDDGIAKFTW